MQLEKARPEFEKRGYRVAGISYDGRAVTEAFSKRLSIGFPLLSDAGSAVIRAFGIYNESTKPDALDYGVPHPGIFILDKSGRVRSKYFEQDYRERFTPATILAKEFGDTVNGREIQAEHLKLTLKSSQDRVRPGNRVTLIAEVELPPKTHVYAPGVEGGYRPVGLKIDANSEITLHPQQSPKARVMDLPVIKERVPVYEGKVRITRDITVSAAVKSSMLELTGSFEYQACDDQICYAPSRVPVTWSFVVESHDRQRVPEEIRKR